ncbi:hypothetical protein EVAR_103787_1 [Eumeta japonica]|uniref:Uncharacterized protein n=1 Tax=Eumeta variegata TaxID=151549 RepID=A0A4C1Z153_EUMVA|nr:hypothetical protein EVAR_103787_1 [Eumeta japonica]
MRADHRGAALESGASLEGAPPLRLPNDAAIAADARYREILDRRVRVIPLDARAPRGRRGAGYRHVRDGRCRAVIISTQLKPY